MLEGRKTHCLQARPCIFGGNVKGWGSEGVKHYVYFLLLPVMSARHVRTLAPHYHHQHRHHHHHHHHHQQQHQHRHHHHHHHHHHHQHRHHHHHHQQQQQQHRHHHHHHHQHHHHHHHHQLPVDVSRFGPAVWPRLVNRGTSVRMRSGSPVSFFLQKVVPRSGDAVMRLCPSR